MESCGDAASARRAEEAQKIVCQGPSTPPRHRRHHRRRHRRHHPHKKVAMTRHLGKHIKRI